MVVMRFLRGEQVPGKELLDAVTLGDQQVVEKLLHKVHDPLETAQISRETFAERLGISQLDGESAVHSFSDLLKAAKSKAGREQILRHAVVASKTYELSENILFQCYRVALTKKYNKSREANDRQTDEGLKATHKQDALEWLEVARHILQYDTSLVPSAEQPNSYSDDESGNALHEAARYRCPEVVGDIIDRLNLKYAQDNESRRKVLAGGDKYDQKPALIFAILQSDAATVKRLIDCDPGLLDMRWHGYHPLGYAIESFSTQGGKWPFYEDLCELIRLLVVKEPRALCTRSDIQGPQGKIVLPPLLLAKRHRGKENLDEDIAAHLDKTILFLENSIFRELSDASEVADALYEQKEQRRQLELNLSDFSYQVETSQITDFEKFVNRFQYIQNGAFEFNSKLFRVQLPDISGVADSQAKEAKQNIRKLLDKLKVAKNDGGFDVKQINRLNAWDNPSRPFEDSVIASIVQEFGVEELDWYKFDLDLEMLKTLGKERGDKGKDTKDRLAASRTLRKLWLYSSGHWATLYHWTGPEGLVSLPQLEEAFIFIVNPKSNGYIEYGEGSERRKILDARIRSIKPNANRPAQHLQITVSDYNRSHHSAPRLLFSAQKGASESFFESIIKVQRFLRREDQPATNLQTKVPPPIKPKPTPLVHSGTASDAQKNILERPARSFSSTQKKSKAAKGSRSSRSIKIAVIDNGVDRWHSGIREGIKDGFSYETQNGQSTVPWFTVADAHGTHMASLIRKINRRCDIYVFRVNTFRQEMDDKKVKKAIQHIKNGCFDVVNMSLSFDHDPDGLENEIKACFQGEDRPLFFCATSDDAHSRHPVFPAQYGDTIEVAAADAYGKRSRGAGNFGDLLILGENLEVKSPEYLVTSEQLISGSSVSTALASGIASLLLVLADKYAVEAGLDWRLFKKKEVMLRLFENMIADRAELKNTSIDPALLFGREIWESGDWKKVFEKALTGH